MFKQFLFCVVLLLCIGCCEEELVTIVSIEPLGKIVDIQIVQGSFGNSTKTVVKCEKGMFFLWGAHSLLFGKEVQIVYKSDGSSWAQWEPFEAMYYMGKK